MIRVCIMTSAHIRRDVRIFEKQSRSLARSGFEVNLLVADGNGDEYVDGVRIVDVGTSPGGRAGRMAVTPWRLLRRALQLEADVYHFHDPELIPTGLVLKLFGRRVIYDAHEDLPRQIHGKHYLPRLVRKPLSVLLEGGELLAVQAFDALVAATPTIAQRFPCQKSLVIQNYPIPEVAPARDDAPYGQRPHHFAYVGGISRERGAVEMIGAIERCESSGVRLSLAGKFFPEALKEDLETLPAWNRVDYMGWLSREDIAKMLAAVRGGLVTLHPTPSYVDSLPIKLFEYMAAGLPVIASDFPIWREIIDEAGCGLLVDPRDPEAIAGAMDWIVANPEAAAAMGCRGQHAVAERYNWGREASKLTDLYRSLTEPAHPQQVGGRNS